MIDSDDDDIPGDELGDEEPSEAWKLAETEGVRLAAQPLFRSICRELRDPLSSLMSFVYALSSDRSLHVDLRGDIGRIHRRLVVHTRLLDELLELADLVQGRTTLNLMSFDVSEVMEKVILVTGQPMRAPGRVWLDAEVPSQVMVGDPVRMGQVFWHLLDNALKFIPNRGSVRITANAENDHLGVFFSDTGIGIPTEVLPYIYDPFVRGGPEIERNYRGHGMGLALTARIVDLHGGTIHTHSEGPGKGTTVALRIPLNGPPTRSAS